MSVGWLVLLGSSCSTIYSRNLLLNNLFMQPLTNQASHASYTTHQTPLCLASHFTGATDTTLAIEDTLTTTTFVSDAIHFTWATLSTDISLSTGATLGNTHYSA